MELRSVETFLAVVEHGTFSRAAERLGYSQSAVTVQVARLERELGVRLFDRLPRGVALTEQGRAFVFHARELLGAAAAARASVSARPGGARELTGTLRLGAVESVSTALLPGLLARFGARCPGVQVVVATERRERMVDGLRGNALDMLLTFEHHLCLSGLATQGLRREAVCFVAAPALLERHGARAAALPADAGSAPAGPLDPAALVRLPFVLTERGESYRLELDRTLAAAGLRLDPVVEAGNTETLVHMAELGVGVAFVPRFAAASPLAAGTLCELTADLPPVEMELQLLHHRNKWIAPHMQVFIDLAREEFDGSAGCADARCAHEG